MTVFPVSADHKLQRICAPSCSLNDSGVKGLEMRNFAPAPIAFARMSGVASVVTKPNVSLTLSPASASNSCSPVMFGMVQSESTRSGFDALMAASALAPSSTSVMSCPSNPARRSVFLTIMRMAVESSTIRIFIYGTPTARGSAAKVMAHWSNRPSRGILERRLQLHLARLTLALRRFRARAGEIDDASGDLRQRMQRLHRSDLPGGARHAPHHTGVLVLGDGRRTGVPHFLHAFGAVAPHSGEHHADRIAAGALRHGA